MERERGVSEGETTGGRKGSGQGRKREGGSVREEEGRALHMCCARPSPSSTSLHPPGLVRVSLPPPMLSGVRTTCSTPSQREARNGKASEGGEPEHHPDLGHGAPPGVQVTLSGGRPLVDRAAGLKYW
eukprot:1031321-Rhodomonas_salina.2